MSRLPNQGTQLGWVTAIHLSHYTPLMAQGSRVQPRPFISLPSQNDSSIHFSSGPWLWFCHKSAEQTDEEEKKERGTWWGGANKGLGILWSYRFTDKRAVMKGSEKCWGRGWWWVQGPWVHVLVCACARLPSRSLRFVSKTGDSPWWKNVTAYVLREDVHGWMSLLNERTHKRLSLWLVQYEAAAADEYFHH